MNDKLLSFLGLIRRAGKLALGMDAVTEAVKKNRALLILTAADTGAASLKKIICLAAQSSLTHITLPSNKEDLGQSLGIGSCAILAITDRGFASAMLKKLEITKTNAQL